MAQFDLRRIEVSIQVDDVLKIYTSPLDITIIGNKYANALQNECLITLTNLDKETRNYILTQTSPYNYNKTPKTAIVKAGRESWGVSTIFEGNIINSYVSQPPDIKIYLQCLTGNFIKGNIITRNQPGTTTHREICEQIARDTNTILNYQATNKNIANYAFAGGALNQVGVAGNLGNYDVFVDNDILVVKDAMMPLSNSTTILTDDNGMIGIPEFTEQGIRVKFLLDNKTRLGGALDIRSKIYTTINGIYVIYKLGFQIANYDNPFYYIADAARIS